MKKRYYVLTMTLIIALGLMLSGCSSSSQEGTEGQSEKQESQGESQAESTYPTKPVKVVVPYSAGGGTDSVTRAISKFIELDQPMVVTNLTGGGGKIGTLEVAGSDPDGYTLLAHSVTAVVSGYYSGLYPERVWQELEPVASMVSQSGGIVVRADSKWETLEDLVAYAKENPGELTIGIPGIGGGSHIISAIFADVTGIEVSYVPFQGSADTRAALAGGHIDVMAGFVSEFYDFIQEGEFRMLASTGSERSPKLPDVPTFEEKGIDFVLNHRNGLFAPKGTPEEVITELELKLKEVAESQEFIDLMGEMVIESAYLSSEDFTTELQSLDALIEPVGHLIKADQ